MARVPASEGISVNIKPLVFLVFCALPGTFQYARADSVEQPDCIALPKPPGVESEKDSFMRAHAEAECFRMAAARVGAEWLKTEQLLKRSLEEAQNKRWDVAHQLVEKARFQAETALQQAGHEARAWQHRVIRD